MKERLQRFALRDMHPATSDGSIHKLPRNTYEFALEGSRIPRLPNVGCDGTVAQACPKGRDCLMHDRVHLTPHHACCDIGSVRQCTTFQSQPSRSVQLLMSMRKTLCGTDVQRISVFVSVWSVMTRFVRQVLGVPRASFPRPTMTVKLSIILVHMGGTHEMRSGAPRHDRYLLHD